MYHVQTIEFIFHLQPMIIRIAKQIKVFSVNEEKWPLFQKYDYTWQAKLSAIWQNRAAGILLYGFMVKSLTVCGLPLPTIQCTRDDRVNVAGSLLSGQLSSGDWKQRQSLCCSFHLRHLPKSSTAQKKLSQNHYKNTYLGYLTLWDEKFLYKSTCNNCSNHTVF